jgi:hypothetical protein
MSGCGLFRKGGTVSTAEEKRAVIDRTHSLAIFFGR